MKTNRSLILFITGALLVIIGLLPRYIAEERGQRAIRAAIDIGSETTKLRVAEVDLKRKKILSLLVDEHWSIPADQSGEVIKEVKERAERAGAKEIRAVATAPFRRDPSLAERLYKETGVKVRVLSQEEEGRLGFLGAEMAADLPKEKLIVWDIGGETFQITTAEAVFSGPIGSIAFRKEINLPTPITAESLDRGVAEAKKLAKGVPESLKKKIQEGASYVVAIGPLFYRGILPLVQNRSFTSDELEKRAYAFIGKEEGTLASNALLVLGFMEELKMRDVTILNVNNSDALLIQP